jgi:hypothetical protein
MMPTLLRRGRETRVVVTRMGARDANSLGPGEIKKSIYGVGSIFTIPVTREGGCFTDEI